MTENPECVTPNATLADAAKKMRDLDVGIIPVVDSDQNRRLRGVITDRDIAVRAVAEGKDIKSTKVSDCMTDDVETVNKNDMVRDVMNVMKREQVRRVPVTDREGRLVGIIAQADVALDITDDHGGAHLFADTVERISEPGHPETNRQARFSASSHSGSQSRSKSGSSRSSRSGSSSSSQSNRSTSSSKDERGSNE
jgi:CBS domain-containing protein